MCFPRETLGRVTPRKVRLSTCGTGMSSSFSITFSFIVKCEKSFAGVLLRLIPMHHSSAQELTLLMVLCMTCVAVEVCSAEVHAARLSAYREFVTLGGRVLTMSFTYVRNRVGERTLPFGTPLLSLITLLSDASKLHSGHSEVKKAADPSVHLTFSQQFPLQSCFPHSVERLWQIENDC